MPAFILRLSFLLLFGLGAGLLPAAANHLIGGELTYRYLGADGPANRPFRYEITASIYYDIGAFPIGNPTIPISFISRGTNRASLLAVTLARTSNEQLSQSGSATCTQQSPEITLARYVRTVDLPPSPEGYTATTVVNARSFMVTNLSSPDTQAMSLSVDMTPGRLPNASPIFSDRPIVQLCLGDTSYSLNNAYDPDGDRLSYRFGTPTGTFGNYLTPNPVDYATGYSTAAPFGASGYVAIDASTGLARYRSLTQGAFLVAVDVSEYRFINGQEVLLGTMRRDIQLVVRACSGPVNQPPAFAASPSQRNFDVAQGQTLSLPISATDPEGQALSMAVSSVLLDGAGPIQATVNGQPGDGSPTNPVGRVQLTGTGTVTGNFQFVASCVLARPEPYDVIVSVSEDGCNPKSIATIFRITVLQPPSVVRIVGDSLLCAGSTARYAAVGPAQGNYLWTVDGGRILGAATGRTVEVQWVVAGATGTVSVRSSVGAGCFTAADSHPVTIRPGLTVTGPAVYCRKTNTGLRYQVSGLAAPYTWSISNGSIVSGQTTNEVVVDVVPGATATLRVVAPLSRCEATAVLRLDDTCLEFYNIITPNGDSRNDVFTIENVERHPNTELAVYNRWGQLVYESADYHNTYGGEAASAGMYFYRCQLADGTTYKGWFEIVR